MVAYVQLDKIKLTPLNMQKLEIQSVYILLFFIGTFSLSAQSVIPLQERVNSSPSYNRPIHRTPPVYGIPGKVGVEIGVSSYSITLETPKGINNLKPGLSITYSSSASNVLMGWASGLGGLSETSRSGSSFVFDGNKKNSTLILCQINSPTLV